MPDWVVPVVALLGIIAGALLKGAVDVWLDERREAKQERAALRLLGQDLTHAANTLTVAAQRRIWWPPEWAPTWVAWDEHRQLLASRLGSKEWSDIASAFYVVQSMNTNRALVADGKPLDDVDSDHAEQAIEIVATAQGVIERLLAGQAE